MTTTYALIAKYQKQQAVYTRTETEDGGLTASFRFAEGFDSYSMAKKIVEQQGFTLVKSWKAAEELALEAHAAAQPAPGELVWKNKVNGWHRATTDNGVYNIRRWLLQNGEWVASPEDGSAIGAAEDREWRMTFDVGGLSQPVPWLNPEQRHTLTHARESCQQHANTHAK
jgi:hypothetical protein